MKKAIAIMFVCAFFPFLLNAQTPSVSYFRTGVGVVSTELNQSAGLSERMGNFVGPTFIIEYEHPFTSTLSYAFSLGLGHASIDGTLVKLYETNSDNLPQVFNGVLSQSSHFFASSAILFRPVIFFETGLGVCLERKGTSHSQLNLTQVSYGDYNPETHSYEREERVYYESLSTSYENNYGIVVPVRLHVYSNDCIAVSAFYNVQYWRKGKGRWGKGSSYMGIMLGFKL